MRLSEGTAGDRSKIGSTIDAHRNRGSDITISSALRSVGLCLRGSAYSSTANKPS